MSGEVGTLNQPIGARVIVFAGPPSAGKTSVIRQVVPRLAATCSSASAPASLSPQDICYAKVDVVLSRELRAMERLGWRCEALVEPDFCPDQTWFERLPGVLERASDASLLVVETAGLCARCSPYIVEGLAVVIVEATAGLDTVDKLGPLMSTADLCVVTHGDRLSQGERDLLRARLEARHASERIFFVNGLTGEGAARFAATVDDLMRDRAGRPPGGAPEPRSEPPRLFCSLCLGRKDLPIPDAPMVSP